MLNKNRFAVELPTAWRSIRSGVFIGKLGILAALLCLGFTFIASNFVPLVLLGVLLVGAMFAHAIELQHQCLHGTAFKNPLPNHLVGTALGLPMFVSFTKYRSLHLKHHRNVGTQHDTEFFSYGKRLEELSTRQLLVRSFSLKRYHQVARDILHYLFGIGKDHDGFSGKTRRAIRREYGVAIGLLVALAIPATFMGSSFLLKFWLLPALFLAEPIHFWIELPEHFRCAKLTDSSLAHTRTIRGSLFSFWFTNGNNFHVEHHLFQHLPIDRLPAVHSLIDERIVHYESGYPAFFQNQVLKRTLEHKEEANFSC